MYLSIRNYVNVNGKCKLQQTYLHKSWSLFKKHNQHPKIRECEYFRTEKITEEPNPVSPFIVPPQDGE